MRAGLITVLQGLLAKTATAPSQPHLQPPSSAAGPNLAMLGTFTQPIADVASSLKASLNVPRAPAPNGSPPALPDALKLAAQKLGNSIHAQYTANHPGAGDATKFVTSNGAGLKAELRTAILNAVGQAEAQKLEASGDLGRVVDMAFNIVASKMLPNGEVAGTSTQIPNKFSTATLPEPPFQLPDLRINNVTYRPTQHVGSGGFGDVFFYRADNGRTVAVKIAREITPGAVRREEMVQAQLDDFRDEVANHAALAQGSANIIGFEGGMRLSDGRVAMALEAAAGSYGDFITTLDTREGDGTGQVPTDLANVARFAQLKQAARGLQEMFARGSFPRI